jgi:predicted lipoprotein with Yx(FWY)xxD motif
MSSWLEMARIGMNRTTSSSVLPTRLYLGGVAMRRMLMLIAAGLMLLAACGDDEAEPAAGEGQDDQQETAATVLVADSDLGEILVDTDGNTLYMFMPDEEKNGEPTCYDDCADAWPAFEATDEPTAGDGVDQSLLATVDRTDGSEQVTYKELPLYHFSGDEAAGDTNGQGLNEVWWVLAPDGRPIRGEGASEDPYGTG